MALRLPCRTNETELHHLRGNIGDPATHHRPGRLGDPHKVAELAFCPSPGARSPGGIGPGNRWPKRSCPTTCYRSSMATIDERSPGVWQVRVFTGRNGRWSDPGGGHGPRGQARGPARSGPTRIWAPAGCGTPNGGRRLTAWLERNEGSYTPASLRDQTQSRPTRPGGTRSPGTPRPTRGRRGGPLAHSDASGGPGRLGDP